jgi:spore germination cell wall hydrolase CwlJ-like protein
LWLTADVADFMLASLRPALLLCAALGAATVAPAQADPSNASLAAVTAASLPEVPVPDLLDPDGEPQLAGVQEEEALPSDNDQPEVIVVRRGGNLTTLVADLRGADAGSRELECLATGVYFEAKSEPLTGQLAVGQVIANRANSGGRFPGSYCGVLFQRGQFSFVHGRSLPAVPRSSRQWQTAVAIAKIVDQDLKDSEVGNALFFHARYVSPGWRLKRVAAIGNHVFYR